MVFSELSVSLSSKTVLLEAEILLLDRPYCRFSSKSAMIHTATAFANAVVGVLMFLDVNKVLDTHFIEPFSSVILLPHVQNVDWMDGRAD